MTTATAPEPDRPARLSPVEAAALDTAARARHELIVRKRDGTITLVRAPGRLILDDEHLRMLAQLQQLPDPAYVVHHHPTCDTPAGLHDYHLGDVLVIGHRYADGGRAAYRITDRVQPAGLHFADRIA